MTPATPALPPLRYAPARICRVPVSDGRRTRWARVWYRPLLPGQGKALRQRFAWCARQNTAHGLGAIHRKGHHR